MLSVFGVGFGELKNLVHIVKINRNNYFFYYSVSYYTMKYFTGVFDADCGILYELLERVDFYSGSERQRMLRHRNDGNMGSMLFGYTWKGYLKKNPDERKPNSRF